MPSFQHDSCCEVAKNCVKYFAKKYAYLWAYFEMFVNFMKFDPPFYKAQNISQYAAYRWECWPYF
jgi:hypothetical protein